MALSSTEWQGSLWLAYYFPPEVQPCRHLWSHTMVSWAQVTHTVLATPGVLRGLAGLHGNTAEAEGGTASVQGLALAASATTPFRSAVVQLMLFFEETYRTVFGFQSPPLHDPCAIAFVIDPSLFKVGRSDGGVLFRDRSEVRPPMQLELTSKHLCRLRR